MFSASMDVFTIIAQTATPIIFISAIGLLTLTYQNRYGRIKDSVYTYQKQKISYLQQGEKNKAEKAEQMLTVYQKEAMIIKDSMIAAFISILFIALTSLLLLLQGILQPLPTTPLEYFILISFTLAILSLVVSVCLIIAAMIRSVKTLNHEIENDDEGIRFGL